MDKTITTVNIKKPLSPGAFFLNKIQIQTLIKQEQ